MISSTNFLQSIIDNASKHSRGTTWYSATESTVLEEIALSHGLDETGALTLGELGQLNFPYFKMGNIDSNKLFGLDELILFAFYFANRNRYKKTLDLGANIGLHTLVMKKLNFQVTSYEPDIFHLDQIKKVMELNGFSTQGLIPKAISNESGTKKYVRILDNTTGSHLIGSKENYYGPVEIVTVEVDDILQVLNEKNYDFIKMDVEGHESVLLQRMASNSIDSTDVMLEIGSSQNAEEIFEIILDKKIPAYAQKINWSKVEKLEDLPSHHTHGSLFLSLQGPPKWSQID